MTARKTPDASKLPADNEASKEGAASAPAILARVLTAHDEIHLNAGSHVVACSQPGLRRGGITHTALAVYKPDELTHTQIHALRREPKITIVEIG